MSNVWLTGFSTTIAQPVCDIFPKLGSFYGGTPITVHGDVKLVDTSLDTNFAGQTIPSGWTPTLISSGRYQSSFNGLTLSSGILAGSSASVAYNASYEAFDATLSVVPLTPGGLNTGVEVDPITFTFTIDGSNYASIIVRCLAAFDPTMLFVDTVVASESETGGTVISGGLLMPSQPLALRIVRYTNYLYLFVNGIQLAQTNQFEGTGDGTFSVSTANLSAPVNTSVLITSLTLRSNVIIGGQLMQNKVDFATRRITGTVPATSIEYAGNANTVVFGPWGSTTLASPFVYTMPTGKTLGGQIIAPMIAYDDPAVRDF